MEDKYIVPVMAFIKEYVFKSKFVRIWYELEEVNEDAHEITFYTSRVHSTSSSMRDALVTLLVVRQGHICWDDLRMPPDGVLRADRSVKCNKSISLISKLHAMWKDKKVKYIVLTDEFRVAFVSGFYRFPGSEKMYMVLRPFQLSQQTSLRCILGLALNRSSPGHHFDPMMSVERLRGVLGRDSDEAVAMNSPAVNFSDFDLFTIQHRRPDALAFLDWKSTAEKRAVARLPVVGDILGVAVNRFAEKEPLLHFTLPLDKPRAETSDLLMNNPRPRQSGIDEFLQLSQGTLQFRIDKVVRSGTAKFSQVFFGSLLRTARGGTSTVCETPICLKLFDEVLFPIKVRIEDLASDPRNCCRSLHFASDMMRREHATYQRLQYLQGTLLPHNYGFHEFTLPDGRSVWGLFLECIHGDPLSSFPLHTWPESVQRTTVSKLRHSVRALLYGGVQQADWHLDQVLVVESPGSGRESQNSHNPDFVLIDFAFTRFRLGEAMIAEHFRIRDQFFIEVADSGLSFPVVKEEWLPYDDFES
ncbi:hypothetical protein WG66_004150 [Moniliophthora roreri]|nr:hypothetical protein WG66_004150 [Moniliophthora roreri]